MPVGELYDANVLEIQAKGGCPASVLLASITDRFLASLVDRLTLVTSPRAATRHLR